MTKSIGQILKNSRQKRNLTIDDVYKIIKINPRYLKAIESDDYSIFEGKVHAKGFLKIYTDFLEENSEEIIALWRREYESYFEKSQTEKFNKIKSLEPEKLVITPTLIGVVFGIILLLVFFIYLFFQYRAYTGAPTLNIYYPDDNLVTNSDILDITGSVELDSDVFINNQKIFVNTDGNFLTSVKLREGINTISIKVINRLNKETEKTRTIIFRPERNNLDNNPVEQTTPSESPENNVD